MDLDGGEGGDCERNKEKKEEILIWRTLIEILIGFPDNFR